MNLWCIIEGCGKPVENRDLGLCSSHNKLRRKIDNVKIPDDPRPIPKVSQSQSALLNKYALLKKKFLLGRWCAVHGKPCIPSDIHHAKGRQGFADDQQIPLLVDVRYFVAVCREGHRMIEENPVFAKENGFSESRLI